MLSLYHWLQCGYIHLQYLLHFLSVILRLVSSNMFQVQAITHRIFNFIFKKFSMRKLEYTALLQAITTASS